MAELQTIIECTPELVDALKDDLSSLSGELLAVGLINSDNEAALMNQNHNPTDRAAALTGFIRNRVKIDPGSYAVFIETLKRRETDHKSLLKILDKKYKELGMFAFCF